ncbi:MAG: dihydroorotate dehydrogenase-like protein [Acidobacteriota bacterium]
MDLSTTYMGFRLDSPLMPGASPLVDELDTVRMLEDAGAAAIVLRSLFEEQIIGEQLAATQHLQAHENSFAEALSYLPEPEGFMLGPEEYLEHIRRVKACVGIPVFASLNGTTPGGWLEYARLMEEAGADALELNVYFLATDFELSGDSVERRTLEMVRKVKESIHIPVGVKLSPYYSSMAHFARSLEQVGTDGLVLFNRFYQADIDVEELEVVRSLRLSEPSELLLRLRWLALLWGRLRLSLAVTGGVHSGLDAVKAVMAGAHAVQMVSALLKHGPRHLRVVRDEMVEFMKENEYESLQQMQGNMSLLRCPDPNVYERSNYMRILQSWPR